MSLPIPPRPHARAIEGISAVLLPYRPTTCPTGRASALLLARTWSAGLTPAVNMDTGYVQPAHGEERAARPG